jgi:hypothetical protein
MKKLLTTASVLVGLTISFNLLANSDIHLEKHLAQLCKAMSDI